MRFTEERLEQAIIELLEEEGYPRVLGRDIARDPSEVLIKEDLRHFLAQQYADDNITPGEIDSISASWRCFSPATYTRATRPSLNFLEREMNNTSEILIYKNPGGDIKIDVRLDEETVWLTQKQMAELFQVKPQNITMHLKNIYLEGELNEEATCKDFLQVQTEGSRKVERKQKFYNLDAIISVGYRIKSQVATQFRIWATQRLKEYIVKGFVLNDERFKSGSSMDYFTELQERIREIRLSERFFYQKIKDIYATSIDYDPKDEKTIEFFKIVQNKLLWAISKQTAAELVYRRVDASLPLLGMDLRDALNF